MVELSTMSLSKLFYTQAYLGLLPENRSSGSHSLLHNDRETFVSVAPALLLLITPETNKM